MKDRHSEARLWNAFSVQREGAAPNPGQEALGCVVEPLRGKDDPEATIQDEYERLCKAFGEVGADAEESDVEFAWDAQREAVGDA